MSAWAAPAPQPAIELPAGVAVAHMGRRIGAWFTDRIVAGFLIIIPMVVAIASGAVSLNQQAMDQFERSTSYSPFDDVTTPLFNINTGPLWFAGALWILLSFLYYVVPWVVYGSTLGQRMLELKVLDIRTGQKLGLPAAAIRWVVLEGVVMVIGLFILVEQFVQMSRTPANEIFGYSGQITAMYGMSGLYWLASLATYGWMIALLATALTHFARRGLHDRIVGSIVVGPAPVQSYGYAPGWGPQAPYGPPGSQPMASSPGGPQSGWQRPPGAVWPQGPAGPWGPQGWPGAPQGWPAAPQGWSPAQQGWPGAPQAPAQPGSGSPEPESPPAQDQAPDQP